MQCADREPFTVVVLGRALWRVILGFFKVAIVSVLLIKAQHLCIAALEPGLPLLERASLSGLIWAIYPLFLYANFSGYTDFVIGIALLYGFSLPENFDNPFASENFIAFWSRWHITLSNWLKTYVYMPIWSVPCAATLTGGPRRISVCSPISSPSSSWAHGTGKLRCFCSLECCRVGV